MMCAEFLAPKGAPTCWAFSQRWNASLDFTNRGPLVLISHFQTPTALTTISEHDLEQWLRERKVRPAAKLAAAATHLTSLSLTTGLSISPAVAGPVTSNARLTSTARFKPGPSFCLPAKGRRSSSMLS